MHVGVIGTGYVGLVTGISFSEFGVTVTCVDNDSEKIEKLKQGVVPFYEPGIEELLKKNQNDGRLIFTTNIAEAVQSSLIIFIAVGTPPRGDGKADLQYVKDVAKSIAHNMDGYKVIVTKSTVPVGTGDALHEIIKSHVEEGVNFDIVSNPEFLREGSALEDSMRPNRVVIGASSQQAVAIMKDLYNPLYLIETPMIITDVKTAELIKYASNAFLATKISFINEIANLCESVGGDVHTVAKAMGLDKRIGSKFLHPGPGYGGSCFPKDTVALLEIGKEHGIDLNIVDATVKVNTKQKERMVDKITHVMGDLKDKVIAILGLSFKPNTDDIREAPSLFIIEKLLEQGAVIRAFDPIAIENVKKIFPHITYCDNPYEAAQGADAIVFVTEWNQLRNLDLEKLKNISGEYFFDLRNIYEPHRPKKVGFRYFAVGRS